MQDHPAYAGKKLLAVLAHPDDETFGMGGTLALYARRGVAVHLICATRGEVGEIDPQYKESLKSAACVRTQELRCAAAALGISQIHFLNYRDSGMSGDEAMHHPNALAAQPVEKVAGEVAHLIRKIQPEVVLTFDPIGGYRHPDHLAMHQATVLAFEMAGSVEDEDPEGYAPYTPDRLYFHTINRTFLKIVVWVLKLFGQDPRKYGKNKDIDLVAITEVSYPTHVKIDYRDVKDVRERASQCHASQGGEEINKGIRGIISWLFNGYYETFMQAYPSPDPSQGVKQDLFQ